MENVVDKEMVKEEAKKYKELMDALMEPEMLPLVVGKSTAVVGSVVAERCVEKTVGDIIDAGLSVHGVIKPITKFDTIVYAIGKKSVCTAVGLAAAKVTYNSLDRTIGFIVDKYYKHAYGIDINEVVSKAINKEGDNENGNVSDATTE